MYCLFYNGRKIFSNIWRNIFCYVHFVWIVTQKHCIFQIDFLHIFSYLLLKLLLLLLLLRLKLLLCYYDLLNKMKYNFIYLLPYKLYHVNFYLILSKKVNLYEWTWIETQKAVLSQLICFIYFHICQFLLKLL